MGPSGSPAFNHDVIAFLKCWRILPSFPKEAVWNLNNRKVATMKCEGCEICRGREISLWMALGDILPLIEMVPVSDEQLLCFRLSADAMDVLATGPSFALENTSLAAIIQLMKALPLSAEQLVRVDLTWEVEE